jgi:hypothetical protein
MTSSAVLRKELSAAARRMMNTLRQTRRWMKIRLENPGDRSIPSVEECRLMIELRSTQYAVLLSRYRASLEKTVRRRSVFRPVAPSIRRRMEMRRSRSRAASVRLHPHVRGRRRLH